MYDFVDVLEVHKRRLMFVGVIVCAFVAVMAARMYRIQVIDHDWWAAKGVKTVKYNVSKKRGMIFDRNGGKLAISSPVRSCYICPEEVLRDQERVVSALAEKTGEPRDKIVQASLKKSKFVWIKRSLQVDVAAEIQKMGLPGVYFKNEFKRIYPYDGLASNLIGCVGQDKGGTLDNKGLEGVEAIYDSYMRGVMGVVKKQFESKNMTTVKPWDVDSRYFGGISVHLTIDDVIQSIVEKEADELCRVYKPKSAFIIIMNPLTGELLAVANRPNYDNNAVGDSRPEYRKNRALLDVYEPGSTFKIITFSAALEEKAISPNELFNCQGSINVFGDQFVIKCHDVHGKQTFLEAFANSCNPATIQIANRLGKEKFYEYAKKYGFGKVTGLLPHSGESPGILRAPRQWSALSLASMSMGQEIGVNGVQAITAMSAILNDGVMMKPMLVSAFEDTNSRTMKRFEPEAAGRIVSSDTAEKMKQALRKVVLSGTGKKAALEGYDILGKTGTAQKSGQSRTYEAGRYFSSFMGFINEPHFKLSILVVVNEPELPKELKDLHGGTVAAPSFRNVAEKILMYYNILPQEKKIETFVSNLDAQRLVKVPDIVGLAPAEIKNRNGGGLKVQFLGNGPIVVKQFPRPFKYLHHEENIIAYLGTSDDLDVNRKGEKAFFMPALVGKSMKEALEILKNYNLASEFVGSGFVAEQKPLPGELLNDGGTVRLTFSMNRN